MKPRVLVTIDNGVGYVYVEGEVEVLLVDWDVEGTDQDRLTTDPYGTTCSISSGFGYDDDIPKFFEHFKTDLENPDEPEAFL